MTVKTAKQILTEAADIIERNGWVQGRFYDYRQFRAGTPRVDCSVCLVGAINIAMWGDPVHPLRVGRPEFYWQIMDALEVQAGTESVDDWNDAGDRTAEEVTTLLRTTAERINF